MILEGLEKYAGKVWKYEDYDHNVTYWYISKIVKKDGRSRLDALKVDEDSVELMYITNESYLQDAEEAAPEEMQVAVDYLLSKFQKLLCESYGL